MAMKLDKQKTKHQFIHLLVTLATTTFCMGYMKYRQSWENISNFCDSLLVPTVFIGEIIKVFIARYYAQRNDDHPKQRHKKSSNLSASEFFNGFVIHILCIMLIAFMCIILGAPVLQSYEQTFVLSTLITLMAVSPLVFLLGASGALQVCFCEKPDFLTKADESALSLFKYSALGAIFGAWTGSIVAPLDWDRDWQVYPIPNVIGALLGNAFGNLYAFSRVVYAIVRSNMKKRT